MKVSSWSEWTAVGGNKRGWSEGLDEQDGVALAGLERWEAMSWVEQHDFLQQKADILVLAYMRKCDAISQNLFEQRVREVRG